MRRFRSRSAFGFVAMEGLEARVLYSVPPNGYAFEKVNHSIPNTTSTTLSASQAPSTPSLTVASSWSNTALTSESSPFQLTFDATPTQNDENVVIGLSNGPAAAYTDLAAIVRFNPTGQIDVRDGWNYQADATVNYTAGTTYAFTMVVDPTTQTYSVYVTPAGGSEILLAQNYAFRGEQAGTSTLDNLGGYGLVGSAAVTGISVTPVTPTTPPLEPISSGWQNSSITSQSEPFTLNFSATPTQNDENVVMGLSNGPAAAYTDLAAIVRFNPTGQIDVRDGSNYQADATVNYTAGTTYAFTMVVDPTTQTYSVYVTPAGGSQILLAQNYAFRTEQANTTTLNNFGDYGLVGAANITNFNIDLEVVTPAALIAPTAPSGLSATASSASEVDLSWSSIGSVQGFYILRSTDDRTFTQIATVGATASTYADTTVSSSTTYYYEVEAYDAAGVSSASNMDSATTPNIVTTPPPTGTSGSAGTGTLPNGAPMPGPTNTGPSNPSIITPYTGPSIVTTAGTVIENASITGEIEIDAPNVTIENCTFDLPEIAQGQPGYNDSALQIDNGADNVIVENSSFTGGGPGTVQIFSLGHNLQCLNLNIYNTPTDPFQLAGSTTISGCWLHEIGWNAAGNPSSNSLVHPTFTGSDHVNDIFFDTGAFLTVTNNNFDTQGNPTLINGVYYSLSSFCIFTIPYDSGMVVGPVTINNNYLDGGGYMFSLCGQGPTSITNNIMGSDESYGLLDGEYIGGPWTWNGNITQTGATIQIPGVDAGVPVGQS
jgi:Tfp pilus assembly protein FimT